MGYKACHGWLKKSTGAQANASLWGVTLMRSAVRLHIVILCLAFIFTLSIVTEVAAAKFDVINHVFTSRVVQGKDGDLYVQDTLIGFQQGTASFHTVTQVVLEAGTYNIKMELKDPTGAMVSTKTLPAVKAQHANWSEALWVEWPNVRFNRTGRHELSIVLDGKVMARFYLLVS